MRKLFRKNTPWIVSLLSIGLFGFLPRLQFLENNLSTPEMVEISGGKFIMGQNDGEGDEKPEHVVLIDDFYIGKFEITVSAYKEFCRVTNRAMPPEPEWGWLDNHPIINTSWNDAVAYIEWLNFENNESYRLPTEAEFEYVIRNGGESGIYPWGRELPENENLADLTFEAETSSDRIWKDYDDGFAYTAPVGSFEPNKLGVYDINGNIWEWCLDWYGEYSGQEMINPKGPLSGHSKVGRGASYDADPWHSRTASRAYVEPTFKRPGFRLAKNK